MTNYTKSTNFATKDTLTSGDPLKIVKGTEINTEFDNIQTAVNSKSDTASPTFTGTVTIPSVNISGGSITGITDLAVSDGGTGASTAANARTNLGLTIGTNVQAWDADLDTWATKTAPTGSVVGTSDTQTLTNKTLSTGLVMAVSAITTGGSAASTSGTTIDFTSIPSWVKRITVMFNETSLNGSSSLLVQIGSGSITTSGYVSTGILANQSSTTTGTSSSSGFVIYMAGATYAFSGLLTLTLATGNTWVSGHSGKCLITAANFGGGSVALSGVLDRLRITTVNGTDTFDAGTVSFFSE